ncbi:MAG: hypothetical protein ABI792_00805 [bacterium]
MNSFSFGEEKDPAFLNFSDVHFDPFYDTTLVKLLKRSGYKKWEKIFLSSHLKKLSSYGNDSNYPLFKSSLEDMKARIPDPEIIIITGDFMSHNFNKTFERYTGTSSKNSLSSFIMKTIGFTQFMITKYFPSSQIFVTVGNDDADCGNYMIEPGGKFIKEFYKLWSPYINRKERMRSFNYTFKTGAYGIADIRQSSKNKMIILNTIFFSVNYKNLCGDTLTDPGAEELTWFRKTLESCRSAGFKAWLSFHIPPGIDIYSTIHAKGNCEEKIFPAWKQKYNDAFLKTIKDYSDVITASFGGHFHRDAFRVIYNINDPVSFIHLTPSISPVYGNNPAYHIFVFNKFDYELLNYETYYLKDLTTDSAHWSFEYDFKSSFNQDMITPRSLNNVNSFILSDTTFRAKYIRYYSAHNEESYSGDYAEWYYNWCGIGHLEKQDYANCLCSDSASVK